MLLTPRAPSTAAEGGVWLCQLFQELVEVVGAGGGLGHFAGPHISGRVLLVSRVIGAVEQRREGKSLGPRDALIPGVVEGAGRAPDIGLELAYVEDLAGEMNRGSVVEPGLFGLVEELREREMRLEAVPIARPRRGPQVCSCSDSRHDRDSLTAPAPRAPSTAAEGAWRIIRRR
jgi:hypothetical protein